MHRHRNAGFYLVPTQHTQRLATTLPAWGDSWNSTLAASASSVFHFQRTHCCDAVTHSIGLVQHIVINALARHAARVRNVSDATVCVVAAPPRGGCEQWDAMCPPGTPLVVADVADVDDFHAPLCATLWRKDACRGDDPIYRLVSSPPVLVRRRVTQCRMLTVPWPSHARSPDAALQPRTRNVRIALACGVTGHVLASKLGFEKWRRRLRDSCNAIKNKSLCTTLYQSLVGSRARSAIELYSRSTFCLQPPGDTIVRTGIVDAISVGCIPVVFHPAQATLWPQHWSANAGMLFDWTGGAVVDFSHSAPAAAGAANATEVLRKLIDMPAARVRELQARVLEAARRVHYRGELGRADVPDAIDVLVDVLRSLPPTTPT